jgi:hypothetical protein
VVSTTLYYGLAFMIPVLNLVDSQFLEQVIYYADYLFVWLCGTGVKTVLEDNPSLKAFLRNLLLTAFIVFVLTKALEGDYSKDKLIVIVSLFTLISTNILRLVLNIGKQIQDNPKLVWEWLVKFLRK